MKLSVLIPTYNYDCSRLVQQLLEQLPKNGEAEVIVGDDCSTEPLGSLSGCRIYRPDHNLGRAAIRNALAREAKGEWLLFIDADAEVRSATFIADYLDAIKRPESETERGTEPSTYNVICGGTGNLPRCPRPAARLRYEYEVAAEKRLTLSQRQRSPYAQFTTFNFLIRRSLFLSIGFDEHLREYGHEDTFFGLELKRRGISILHIDNKLTHLGLEDADVYLTKTETALRTLAAMDIEQQKNVRVSALALRLKRLHLLGLVRAFFRMSKPLLRANLLGKHPSIQLFALYKLGYFSNTLFTKSGATHQFQRGVKNKDASFRQ